MAEERKLNCPALLKQAVRQELGLGPQDGENGRTIAIYERGSQFELLNAIKTTYMRVKPVPERLRKMYSLVRREYRSEENR